MDNLPDAGRISRASPSGDGSMLTATEQVPQACR